MGEEILNVGPQAEPGSASHWAALEQRVTGLERGVQDILGTLRGLSGQLIAGQKPQWGVIWSALGVMCTGLTLIGGLAYMPVIQNIARLDIAHEKTVDKITAAIERLDDRIRSGDERIRAELVPRTEHQRIWDQTVRNFERLDNRISTIERRGVP